MSRQKAQKEEAAKRHKSHKKRFNSFANLFVLLCDQGLDVGS